MTGGGTIFQSIFQDLGPVKGFGVPIVNMGIEGVTGGTGWRLV